jgi:hypothetical protein
MTEIRISVEGATPDEIERGIVAAKAIFHRARVTPEAAADGRFAVEGWDDRGFEGAISAEDLDLHALWDEADQAALQACCAGWETRRKPASSNLELVNPYRKPRDFSPL